MRQRRAREENIVGREVERAGGDREHPAECLLRVRDTLGRARAAGGEEDRRRILRCGSGKGAWFSAVDQPLERQTRGILAGAVEDRSERKPRYQLRLREILGALNVNDQRS